ncbi:Elf1-domain-containing protein [Rozella allomycis CSF55]|uniref:Transcription elongation factor 1 homolog n=1 Tax=Rozella allomycis (strain CSF55) TaxID=988480 RepID=A0A4P9YGJ5_ROZAC|nr:Elf1-domain-containing protein [Rozella allomycis CSF55]
MGKRKAKRKAPTKVKVTLEKSFTCPFCNHDKSVEVKLDRDHNVGIISCRVCSADYQSVIHYLSEPIDVYSDWIDACEASNRPQREERNRDDDDD